MAVLFKKWKLKQMQKLGLFLFRQHLYLVVDGLLDLDPIAGSGFGRTAMIFGDDVPTTSPWDGNGESLSNFLAGNFRGVISESTL